MEDRLTILTEFSSLMKNDIVDYYKRSHLYLRDLVSYKNINLEINASTQSENVIETTLNMILKAIKTGLNTLGVSISKLSKIQTDYLNEINKKGVEISNYNSYLDIYLNEYVNKILFEILIEYLLDLDVKKIESLKLFKLVSSSFIGKLSQFKNIHLISNKTKEFIAYPDIEEYLNISDLSIKVETTNKNPKKIDISIMNDEKKTYKSEEGEIDTLDILKQLEKAKKDSIKTLETPKMEVSKPSLEPLEQLNSDEGHQKIIQEVKPTTPITPKIDYVTDEKAEIFLDYIGNLPPVNAEIITRFKINTVNLLNSRVVNPDFLDLENLFYYISIIKMLGIEFPFTSLEIMEILKNYVSGMVFSTSRNDSPDPICIYYGLAILTELDLIHRTNIINLHGIEEFLKNELKTFIPEKLKLNYHTLLSFKLLAKNEILFARRERLLPQILSLDLLNLEEFNPTLDIFHHLGSFKILDRNFDLSQFNVVYINELKKHLTPKGSVNELITESAKMLLILNLLNVQNQESLLCNRLLNFIIDSTDYFNIENHNKDFNWRIDKLAYKVELKMLFWALLACSQYTNSNF
ncbi:MAG: hypothetical protein KGD65_11930 [Candidatus Lokiarchaeota archaeon]|nr:hypothetical protein [Candidatus Lokiarchaeota archaeon]